MLSRLESVRTEMSETRTVMSEMRAEVRTEVAGVRASGNVYAGWDAVVLTGVAAKRGPHLHHSQPALLQKAR